MRTLIYHPIADEQKARLLQKYPATQDFFSKLEADIQQYPEFGSIENIPYGKTKILPCYKRLAAVELFSGRVVYSLKQLTLYYVYNDNNAAIMRVSLG